MRTTRRIIPFALLSGLGDRRCLLYSAEITPGYQLTAADTEVLVEIAAAEHDCRE
jgi:hypothetical protein